MSSTSVLVLPAVANIEYAAKEMSHVDLTPGHFKDLTITFGDKPEIRFQGKLIESFDAVWLSSFWKGRALAYAIKLYLESHNISTSWVEKSTSKLTDQMSFALAGLPLPKTFFSMASEPLHFLDALENHCGYPCVIKDNRGARGADSILVNNREEFLLAWQSLPRHKHYHIQSFIPNDYDWGIMVVDGQVVSGEQSFHSPEDFRNNACNGATEKFVPVSEIPDSVKELAIQAAQSLQLKWSRADILINKETQEPFLLEVNRSPGITKGSTEEEGAKVFLEKLIQR